jgi:DNA-binding transcriptional LysR family regulator
MDIRQLSYLVALAREQHFTRAAEACGVTQPTLSERIRQLEEELGVPIVRRGQRYMGLTTEGNHILTWAQRILEDCDSLRDDLAALSGSPEGRMVLGVVPSALAAVPPLTDLLRTRYPKLTFSVLSQSSKDIARHLAAFEIDAGITYLDNEPIDISRSQPLYTERYRLMVRHDHPLAGRAEVGWAEAAAHTLCLLTPDMQNRRIIDRAFARANAKPDPEIESNSVVNLCAYIQTEGIAAVLPEVLSTVIGEGAGVKAIPLVDPVVEHTIGLVAVDREPISPLVEALLEAGQGYADP